MNHRHGHAFKGKITPEYRAWQHMKNRCLNPRADQRTQYQDRGITVWPDWQHDFTAFLQHIGPRPSAKHSLDRIENNGNYEPGNVRWATRSEQMSNTRCNRYLTFNGRRQTMRAWCIELGMEPMTLYYRIARGWTVERALTQPVATPRRGTAPTP